MRIFRLALLAFLVVACAKQETTTTTATNSATATEASTSGKLTINGAGASFPYPIYSKWFSEYGAKHPDVQINYQSIGSGGGIKQLTARTVFFGASDGPMTDDQLKAAQAPIMHFPTVLGGVVPVYNIPGVNAKLKFTGQTLANIYLGRITKWNDSSLKRANPGVALPAADIVVVHRSDGSGTTYIFVDYLSKVSPEFKQKVGVSTSVNWPVGVGAKGNEGVAGLAKQTPGAIGYVELIYALKNQISYGSVQNKSGAFVDASLQTVTAAANAAAANMPDDFRVSITNAEATDAYPISSFTWMLLNQNPADRQRSAAMVDFMKWALTDGQAYASDLGYAPLPKSVVDKEMVALEKVAR